ncbi:Nse4-domain-containing protein [Polyplosphaeria fusca]|uniref:Non-structural maintenance of chromosomes element 4 n=1 Tax=Polyplosphaeria fusca TaxID=682080 RepID=A0A9P4QVX4_9PLEO|nr:Nse4-domain-containing protein [Polyplosphaeria fusca]
MARLATAASATPGRASTIDSLYRDPTPHFSNHAATRESTYSVMSPAPSISQASDKENQEPVSRGNTPQPTKRKQTMASARLPTPRSGPSSSANANKRRRISDRNDTLSVCEDEDEVEGLQQAKEFIPSTVNYNEDESNTATRYYDPDQNPELRRELRARIRHNQREMEDNRDELVKPGNNLLLQHLKKQDNLMHKVKQTADAALDSRAMVLGSDLAAKKLANSLHGNAATGLDLDQFVSKAIFFMNSGGDRDQELVVGSSRGTQSRRQAAIDREDDEDDTGDGLDWAVLGRLAAFPCAKRPPVPTFLLGPLSVQKKARATQRRQARSQRQPLGPATRPQELQHSDLKQNENSNLTYLVKNIKSLLETHIETGSEKVDNELQQIPEGEVDSDDLYAALRRQRIAQSPDEEACVSLFDFVVNPRSFGQTVENLFYISFLIREGNVRVNMDKDGLPLLIPSRPHTLQEQREQNVQKHQAIFSIDWPTWQTLIKAFDIEEPLIPHRVSEDTNVSGNAWYG